jgi:hypothetical protein
MTTQQLLPTVPDKHTQEMNAWFEASFNNCMSRHIRDSNEALDNLGDEFGKTLDDLVLELREAFGQERRKMLELLEVCQLLAGDNRYVSGRLDQISRSLKGQQRGITQQKSTETTTVIEEQRTSRVSKTLNIIGDILAE